MIPTSPFAKAVERSQSCEDSEGNPQEVGKATLQMKSLSSKNRALTFPQKVRFEVYPLVTDIVAMPEH